MRDRPWLDRLDRAFGDWALPDPAATLVGLNAAVWVLSLVKADFPARLTLEPALVVSGEVWRLVTFLVIPPAMSPAWMVFWLLMLYSYAQALEAEWGEFRFEVFYAVGAAATVAASAFLGYGLSNVPLNLSLFLAFAELFPEVRLYLFFVIPMKVQWLAWAAWAGVGAQLAFGGWGTRLSLLAGLANWILFFGPGRLADLRRRLGR